MIRLLTENLGLKLLSLAVALLLWLATVGEPDMTTTIAVPVQYRNTPVNFEISSDLTDSAFVEMKGSSGRLSRQNLANNVVIVVDLSGVRHAGDHTFSIQAENVKLPPGVAFLRAVPSQLRLRLEPRVMRDVPVVVRYADPVPDGYTIARQEVSPSTIRIVGPESRVNAISRVQSDPLELVRGEEEQTFHVHPFAGDPQVRVEPTDLVITVKVGLAKAR
ncbi:MAG: hypothetical protein IT167_29440 [Bryobacterales bacterium]|nr:hypothetical protein [Bryobacterales bacterium]